MNVDWLMAVSQEVMAVVMVAFDMEMKQGMVVVEIKMKMMVTLKITVEMKIYMKWLDVAKKVEVKVDETNMVVDDQLETRQWIFSPHLQRRADGLWMMDDD